MYLENILIQKWKFQGKNVGLFAKLLYQVCQNQYQNG